MRATEIIESDFYGNEYAGYVFGDLELTIVRKSDLTIKTVKGQEARLASDLCMDTGREIDWDNILGHLSGQWGTPRRRGFALSSDGRWLAR